MCGRCMSFLLRQYECSPLMVLVVSYRPPFRSCPSPDIVAPTALKPWTRYGLRQAELPMRARGSETCHSSGSARMPRAKPSVTTTWRWWAKLSVCLVIRTPVRRLSAPAPALCGCLRLGKLPRPSVNYCALLPTIFVYLLPQRGLFQLPGKRHARRR